MTTENKNIHSYNCDVYITHNKEVYQVNVLNGLEIRWERKGVAGECSFQIAQEEVGKIEFEEGDEVKVRISKTWMFKGYIFTHSRTSDKLVKFTCYDQLRYLKYKDSFSIENKSVGEIVKMIAKDRGLKLGVIRDSNYKIPSITREDASFFDIILYALETTTKETGEMFVLYDRFGDLTLCNLKHMNRNVVINSNSAEDFEYESTIDKQTYNEIHVRYKSGSNGDTIIERAVDNKSIQKWGSLQLTEKAENGWQASTVAQTLLKFYNSKTKTLRIKNAMGAVEVVAGAVIIVNLDLGDMKLTRNMVVDAVTHKVDDGLYSMDLELIGGEFVSTRGSSSEEASNPKEQSKNSSIGFTKPLPRYRGTITYHGRTLTEDNLNKIIELCRKYHIMPSFILTQMWAESYWGKSNVGQKNNNWSGITWPYKGDSSVKKYKGTKRPAREGGNYVKWDSVEDYLVDHFYLFREGGYYKVRNKTSINGFINGLVTSSRGGEARANYAEGGGYRSLLNSTYSSLMSSIGGKLKELDKLVYANGTWENNVVASDNIPTGEGYIISGNGRIYENNKQRIIVEEAYKMIGKGSYTYGGRASIYKTDCSGFIWMLHKKAGISIGTATSSQKYNGKEVSLSNAKAGDFIVMDSKFSPSGRHVVLCVGNGKIIHNGGPEGRPISIQNIYTYGAYTVRRCWE